ncbi:MAG: type II toxin-antitoxin system PemK/MazF family toxin [Campylobacterales bacterium]|nr:type II toxin-antitoxin system PemK/MazF family toxin [Campylobacterales bacterium]
MKQYNQWNEVKKDVEKGKNIYFHEREIFYGHLGENIGFEQSGKGENFVRPILVYKKFNNKVFLGIPLSTTEKRGKYYFEFNFKEEKQSVAILSQIKLIDSKRLDRKIGKMSIEDFDNLKIKLIRILS